MPAENTTFIPDIDKRYIKWGNFDEITQIIQSRLFYPVWINGDTGNGKSIMIEQACAHAKRELVRINFTTETNENDIIGGLRLKDNSTPFQEGPAITALRRGAILLLDEIDAGHTNKILCLQQILEGKGVIIKATGENVKAAPGFNVFATGNTQGKGSLSGRFLGTSMMNSAFMDRFAAMMLQNYPPNEIETKILATHYACSMEEIGKTVTDKQLKKIGSFITRLLAWASETRKLCEAEKVPELITTRTLVSIIKANIIFDDELKSVKLACGRYPDETKIGFISFYEKLIDLEEDKGIKPLKTTSKDATDPNNNWVPFKKS